jgi:hypothetical protein
MPAMAAELLVNLPEASFNLAGESRLASDQAHDPL